MPRSKPRWGWKLEGQARARKRPYSKDDILQMANILGVSDSGKIANLEAELHDHGHFYQVVKVDFNESPSPAEITATLKV